MSPMPAVPPVARYVVAAGLALALLWWTFDRLLGDRDDPSFSVGGDWVLIRFSGLPLIAVVAGVVMISLGPEVLARPDSGKWIPISLAGLVAVWWAFKARETDDEI